MQTDAIRKTVKSQKNKNHLNTHAPIRLTWCFVTQRDKDLPRELILGCQLQIEHLTIYSQLTLEN